MTDPAEIRRLKAVAALLSIAEDENENSGERIVAAEIVLTDDRECRALEDETFEQRERMNDQIARMESAYNEPRDAMDALPTKP
jgi:hypothetical protein